MTKGGGFGSGMKQFRCSVVVVVVVVVFGMSVFGIISFWCLEFGWSCCARVS